jgi:hypothetical protein
VPYRNFTSCQWRRQSGSAGSGREVTPPRSGPVPVEGSPCGPTGKTPPYPPWRRRRTHEGLNTGLSVVWEDPCCRQKGRGSQVRV